MRDTKRSIFLKFLDICKNFLKFVKHSLEILKILEFLEIGFLTKIKREASIFFFFFPTLRRVSESFKNIKSIKC